MFSDVVRPLPTCYNCRNVNFLKGIDDVPFDRFLRRSYAARRTVAEIEEALKNFESSIPAEAKVFREKYGERVAAVVGSNKCTLPAAQTCKRNPPSCLIIENRE
jgi:hypothetical protein